MSDLTNLKKLRQKTNAPLKDCRQALQESEGDIGEAVTILKKRSRLVAASKAEKTAKEGVVEAYIHANHKVGVLLELNAQTDFVAKTKEFLELAHDLAMHIAAMDPQYISSEEVPEKMIAKEKEIYLEQLKDSGKPKEIQEQIVKGKIEKFFSEVCLYSQPFIKDEARTIKDLINEQIAKTGENIKVNRFMRFAITNQ
mgnify:CR=1 FL=1